MAALTDTHVWMDSSVSAVVRTLSTSEASALVKGSSFARRVRETDPEHGARLCDHGRLLFQECGLCAKGVPALCDPTFAEQRENAKAWLV